MKITKYTNGTASAPGRAIGRTSPLLLEDRIAAFRRTHDDPELWVMACACAVHDRAFNVTYFRYDSREPFIVKSIDPVSGENASIRATGTVRTIAHSHLDHAGWHCLWCGADGIVQCRCGAAVCYGRTRDVAGRSLFTCRDSCGIRNNGVIEAEHMIGSTAVADRKLLPRQIATPLPAVRLLRGPQGK